MLKKIIINPFYLYSIVWTIVIFLYNLKIIKVFPILENEIKYFLVFTIIFSFILGKIIKIKKIRIEEKKENSILFYIILFGWILMFLVEKKIPLLETLRKTGYMYSDFRGIKTFSVIIWTLNMYHSIESYILYLKFKRKKYLKYFLVENFMLLLIYRRGPILMFILAAFIAYFWMRSIKRIFFKIFIFSIIILYLFGISGNIRHGDVFYDTTMLKNIVGLTSKTNFLDPYLWGYVYITSPLSNLLYSLEIQNVNNDICGYILYNFVPDFIQKRLFLTNKVKLLIPELTVQTQYNLSLITFGIKGLYATYFSYNLFAYIYIKFLKKTEYFMTGLLILDLISIFSIFQNMYTYSGVSFCLVYPLLFYLIKKIKKRRKNI